jgi:hypothetical protein
MAPDPMSSDPDCTGRNGKCTTTGLSEDGTGPDVAGVNSTGRMVELAYNT